MNELTRDLLYFLHSHDLATSVNEIVADEMNGEFLIRYFDRDKKIDINYLEPMNVLTVLMAEI